MHVDEEVTEITDDIKDLVDMVEAKINMTLHPKFSGPDGIMGPVSTLSYFLSHAFIVFDKNTPFTETQLYRHESHP